MVELPVGKTVPLQLLYSGAGKVDLEWRSSDEGIATVDKDGVVLAIAEGETFVEAYPAGDESRKGTSMIIVKEEGPILMYTADNSGNSGQSGTSGRQGTTGSSGLPGESKSTGDENDDPSGDGKNRDGNEQGETKPDVGEENIPVEYDPDLDNPPVNPRNGEYDWTIRINDTIEEDTGNQMKVIYKLNLVATKQDGKNCRGSYTGHGTFEVKVDTGEFTGDLLERVDVLKKFDVNIGVKYKADNVSFDVIQYNASDYYNYASNRGGVTVEVAPLVPGDDKQAQKEGPDIAPLMKMAGMGLGFMEIEGSGNVGASTMDIAGIGLKVGEDFGSSGIIYFKLSITHDGIIICDVPEVKTNKPFTGQLSR